MASPLRFHWYAKGKEFVSADVATTLKLVYIGEPIGARYRGRSFNELRWTQEGKGHDITRNRAGPVKHDNLVVAFVTRLNVCQGKGGIGCIRNVHFVKLPLIPQARTNRLLS